MTGSPGDALEWEHAVRALQTRLGYRFEDRRLLDRALTHSSWAHEQGEGEDFERLELLGDAVLGLVAVEWLLEQAPEEAVGDLAKRKSFLVSASMLSQTARELGIGPALRLGVGEAKSGGAERSAVLADACEAVLGALFLEAGLEAVRGVMAPFLRRAAEREAPARRLQHAKTRLQELAQARGWALPEYRLLDQSGPDHDRRYTYQVWVADAPRGAGTAASKKTAQLRAAAEALDSLTGESNLQEEVP